MPEGYPPRDNVAQPDWTHGLRRRARPLLAKQRFPVAGMAASVIDGGVHIATLDGMWMMAVLGFAGLAVDEEGLILNPKLPSDWHSLAFSVQWQGRHENFGGDADIRRSDDYRARRRATSTIGEGAKMILRTAPVPARAAL